MNGSRSPSITRCTSPTFSSVRWSFTMVYGWKTYERIWLPQPMSVLVASTLRLLRLLLVQRALVQRGLQHLHRGRLVLVLAALLLAGHHDAGRAGA